MPTATPVVVEATAKRAFAVAVDWPGWCRGGRDEAGALAALVAYGPRYAKVAKRANVAFTAPKDAAAFNVSERLKGGAGTDFGAPQVQAELEQAPLGAERERLEGLLAACWAEFEAAAMRARGKTLRKGPRGGGRELDPIVRHVVESYPGYLQTLGWRPPALGEVDVASLPSAVQAVTLATAEALDAAERGELPSLGPRGGRRWPPRFFIRYAAWHILDHTWEIEDRAEYVVAPAGR